MRFSSRAAGYGHAVPKTPLDSAKSVTLITVAVQVGIRVVVAVAELRAIRRGEDGEVQHVPGAAPPRTTTTDEIAKD
jgi:hypothetical protein